MRKGAVICGGIAVLASGCLFGPSRGPRVIGYRAGRVFLARDAAYRVGPLPAGWHRLRTGARAIAFHDAATGATISTDAFCGAAFEDAPLPTLMGQLFAGLAPERVDRATTLPLGGREALRQMSVRKVDGVPLTFDAVVLKKHACTFDFVCIAPPAAYGAVAPVFEAFVRGFAYE